MRRDALERREALLRAATMCFAESGYLVPLEEIADRAGVGRGTLYRNFRDRMALAIAVFEREIDEIGASADPRLPLAQLVETMVAKGARASALFTRLAAEMPLDGDNLATFKALGSRLEKLIQPVIDKAHADGRMRCDLGADAFLLVLRMVGSLSSPYKPVDQTRADITAAIDMLMQGLTPR